MSELQMPIFPLPDVVLFPQTVLPLHVFEPRYRQMVAGCLAGDRWLAVVKLRPGWERDYYGRPPVHEVAGAAEIIQAEALADGRYNLLLDGRLRVRIEAEVEGAQPYRVVRAHRLADVDRRPGSSAREDRLRMLRATHARLLEALGQAHADVVGRLTVAGMGPGGVIDRIVSAVVPDAGIRQQALEAVDLDDRLELALAALTNLLALVSGPEEEAEESDEV